MRLLAGALVLSLVVATTAAVFAIWPVVADAPWEEEGGVPPTPVVVDSRDEIRCQEALDLRADVLAEGRDAYRTGVRDPEGWQLNYQGQLVVAGAEIDRFC